MYQKEGGRLTRSQRYTTFVWEQQKKKEQKHLRELTDITVVLSLQLVSPGQAF